MYKKIMVFGMVLLIMLCTPLPSYASSDLPRLSNHYMNYVKLELKNGIGENDKIILFVSSSNPIIFSKTLNPNGNGLYLYSLKSTGNWRRESYQTPQNIYNETGGTTSTLQIISEGSNFIDVKILSANHNIYDNLGNLIYGISKNQEFDGRITLPSNDGYKDNGTTFTFWQWYQLPTGVDSTDVKIDPYIDDSKDTYHSAAVTLHQKIPNTSKWNLNINLTVREYGPHTYKVVFKQISTGEVLGTLTRTFEALEGFIDENGDGLDDRTGQPPYDPLEPPDGSATPEWDGTIVGFFKYLIDNVKYYNEMLVSGVQTTIGSIGKVPQMLGAVINLPPEIMALFTFGIIISILLRVLGR